MEKLTIKKLIEEAKQFCIELSKTPYKELFGVTDGKAIGTFVEQKFQRILIEKYKTFVGSSSKGIDLPSHDILTDVKVTSLKQPQSSCPFKDAKQKIFGLGYHLLLFVYDKKEDVNTQTATLSFVNCIFIHKERTADYTITYRLRQMLADGANEADIIAYLQDRNIPADDITLQQIAQSILQNIPEQGCLTISNALQWRLQYQRIVSLEENISGIENIFKS